MIEATGEGAGAAGGTAPGPSAGVRTVVLVEGVSDRVAVEVLARRQGREPAGCRVAVVAMGGITNEPFRATPRALCVMVAARPACPSGI